MTSIRRVVVGACCTPGSLRALRYARDLPTDAALVPVHAWTPPGGELADRRYPAVEMRDVWEHAAWQRLVSAVHTAWGATPDDIDVDLVVARGLPGPVLVDTASHPDDLLIVGSGRRGPVARLLHGQVARYCLAHSECPVLAVPPARLAIDAGHGLRGYAFRHRGLSAQAALDQADRSAA